MSKDERYYQTMVPVIEALTTEPGPLATAAVEAYEVFLENEKQHTTPYVSRI